VPTPLEKARKNPDSMKAKILSSARHLFGEYGYHGVTTRMIAKEVGIDISTLHYHWGDKENLYEAVITDIHDEIIGVMLDIEKIVHGKSVEVRLEVAIDVMCDYLFAKPEVPKLIVVSSFGKTRPDGIRDDRLAEHAPNVAIAMGLAPDKKGVSPADTAMVLAISNAMYSFTSGENTFKGILKVEHDEYVTIVKKTLKFILIPAFTQKVAHN
jgi:AcrR family transcriptional regulator